jgi:2',3'-cyclic-nucleotide 2'-phosphodiesterase / 3'-nucleotidase
VARAIIADKSAIHPVVAAMNVLGYDAATLGNHDFNYGLETLERAYGQARFPVVSCNIRRIDGSPFFPPSVVIERAFFDESGTPQRLRVGVIGAAPPQIALWDEAHVRGRLRMLDIVEAVQAEIGALRSRVDLVVALCHTGISGGAASKGEENAGWGLSRLEGLDALILGHQHLLLPGEHFARIPGVDSERGTIRGKAAVMAGCSGSHLGIIDLELEQDANWRVAKAQVEVRPIARRGANGGAIALARSDTSVLEAARGAHEATLRYVRTPISRLAAPLSTYFALIGDCAAVKLVNEAQRAHAAPLAAARAGLAALPILSAASPFRCGGHSGPYAFTDIAAGQIAIKDAADIYPYPNTLRVVRIDGATLGEWLERSASIFCRIDPNSSDEQPLLPHAFAAYNFDVIDGLDYTIDVTRAARYDDSGTVVAPESRRVRGLTFDGAPVDPEQAFLVVTNNYRASGGGGFPGCRGTNVVIEAPDANRDVVIKYVAGQAEIAPKADGNWRFAPWRNAVVATYLTSPAAAALPAPRGLKLTPMGLAPGGFLKLRVETV